MSTQKLIQQGIMAVYGKFAVVNNISIVELESSGKYQVTVDYCIRSDESDIRDGQPPLWGKIQDQVVNSTSEFVGLPVKIIHKFMPTIAGFAVTIQTTITI